MKKMILMIAVGFGVLSFIPSNTEVVNSEIVQSSSFSLMNDTKEAVSIHTGGGFVTLQKGGKTSITCNVGKEVRWANSGTKGDLIFKIDDSMCGTTVKLSDYK